VFHFGTFKLRAAVSVWIERTILERRLVVTGVEVKSVTGRG